MNTVHTVHCTMCAQHMRTNFNALRVCIGDIRGDLLEVGRVRVLQVEATAKGKDDHLKANLHTHTHSAR